MKNEGFHFKDIADLTAFVESEVISTGELAELLGCTRQYIKKLVDNGTLKPIRKTARERLFWKFEVLEQLNKKD